LKFVERFYYCLWFWLLETKEFIENTIDTWLDGIIKEKSVRIDVPPFDCCLGRCLQSDPARQGPPKPMESSVVKRPLVASPAINSFDVEITAMDIKYPFHVERTAANVYRLTCEGKRD
jgi:hypothetical protein